MYMHELRDRRQKHYPPEFIDEKRTIGASATVCDICTANFTDEVLLLLTAAARATVVIAAQSCPASQKVSRQVGLGVVSGGNTDTCKCAGSRDGGPVAASAAQDGSRRGRRPPVDRPPARRAAHPAAEVARFAYNVRALWCQTCVWCSRGHAILRPLQLTHLPPALPSSLLCCMPCVMGAICMAHVRCRSCFGSM